MNEHTPPITGKKTISWLGISVVAIIVVASLVTTLVVILPHFNQSPLVGKWHFTKTEYHLGNNTYNKTIDYYMEFKPDGTGYGYNNQRYIWGNQIYTYNAQKDTYLNFTWKDKGSGKLVITTKQENSTSTTTISYTIQGSKITFIYLTDVEKEKLYGERVDKIPNMPSHIVDNWDIMINGLYSTIIRAATQTQMGNTCESAVPMSNKN